MAPGGVRGGQNNGPKVVRALISGICEAVPFPSKRDSADRIKVRILKWGAYSGLSRQARNYHRGPHE